MSSKVAGGFVQDEGYLARAGRLLARLDRIPVWGLNYIFLGILGMGSMFTFFDIFNINVSI